MQNVQKFEPLIRQQSPVAPLRVTTFRPSVWERAKTWAKETFTQETVAEVILSTATVALMGWYLIELYFALEHYTIIPLP